MTPTFSWYIDGYADQVMRVVLDSTTYEMRFQWNERDEAWWLSFGDVGAPPTITTKLTMTLDLFAPYKYLEGIPKGDLVIVPGWTNKATRVGRYNIGFMSEIQMIYYSRDDLEE